MAVKKKANPRITAASETFTAAMASGGDEGCARCTEILVGAIAESETADDVEALFRAGGIDEVVFEEVPLPGALADAIVARARTMPPKEGAKTVAWLATFAAITPTMIVAPHRFPGLRYPERKAFVDAIERHVDLFRAWSKDASAERRVAGTHLLACCTDVVDDERALPRQGIAACDLDDLERLVLRALARLQVPWPAFGIRLWEELAGFVSGQPLHWRPIAIEVDGKERRWHFARILGGAAVGEIDAARAKDAVTKLSDADAADLAARWSSGRVFLDGSITAPEERARMFELCVSILLALRDRGFDLDALGRAAPNDASKSSPDVGILSVACIRGHGAELPDDLVPLVARAASQGWWKDEVFAHVKSLSPASLEKVLHAIKPSIYAVPYLALRLDAQIVKTLVFFAASSIGKPHQDEVHRALVGGGAKVVPWLEAIEYPTPQFRDLAKPFVERVVAVLHPTG